MDRKAASIASSNNWQQEEIFSKAELFFDSLLTGINTAEHCIDIDFYIFEFDSLGKNIINALVKAANRGVKVRLIMDGIGSAEDAGEIASLLSASDVQVRIFHPNPFYPNVYHWSITQGNAIQKFIRFLLYINHRDHHKICIIDKNQVWTGSLNISAKHLSKEQGGEGWHDYGVKLTDNDIQPLLHCFDSMWGISTLKDWQPPLQKIHSNLSINLRQLSNRSLIQRIENAKKRIWVCSAYFAPSYRVLKAIKEARKHNVDVRIILPSISDVTIFPILSRTYYQKLINQGVKIYEYQPSILHAKLMLIDNKCMIGSTNLNHRSFYHDLEMDIVLTKKESIKIIEGHLQKDMLDSKNITLKDLNRRFFPRLIARLLRIFKYWL